MTVGPSPLPGGCCFTDATNRVRSLVGLEDTLPLPLSVIVGPGDELEKMEGERKALGEAYVGVAVGVKGGDSSEEGVRVRELERDAWKGVGESVGEGESSPPGEGVASRDEGEGEEDWEGLEV